jgi:hypothetical protein
MDKNKLPTSEEYFLNRYFSNNISEEHKKIWLLANKQAKESINIMIEFTKLHLEAQKEAILKNVKLDMKKKSLYDKKSKWKKVPLKQQEEGVDIFSYEVQTFIDKNSIKNAYPLNNVK